MTALKIQFILLHQVALWNFNRSMLKISDSLRKMDLISKMNFILHIRAVQAFPMSFQRQFHQLFRILALHHKFLH